MTIEGSPVNGIISDDSDAARIFENTNTMQNEGLFSVEVNRKDFGLIRLKKRVIALTTAGYSSKGGAKRFGISEAALRLHLTNICDKLRVSNQFELILFAFYHQLIDTYEIPLNDPSGTRINLTHHQPLFLPARQPNCVTMEGFLGRETPPYKG
jgi:DNA-binding CsgD family transcriptional regulator